MLNRIRLAVIVGSLVAAALTLVHMASGLGFWPLATTWGEVMVIFSLARAANAHNYRTPSKGELARLRADLERAEQPRELER